MTETYLTDGRGNYLDANGNITRDVNARATFRRLKDAVAFMNLQPMEVRRRFYYDSAFVRNIIATA